MVSAQVNEVKDVIGHFSQLKMYFLKFVNIKWLLPNGKRVANIRDPASDLFQIIEQGDQHCSESPYSPYNPPSPGKTLKQVAVND